jgi:hypothetical protein
VNWTADPATLTQQLNSYFTSKGVATTETPYWVSKAAELVQRGQQLNDPTYADKRLAAADIFGGQSAPQTSATAQAAPTSLAPFMTTPNVAATATPYAPVIPISQLMTGNA